MIILYQNSTTVITRKLGSRETTLQETFSITFVNRSVYTAQLLCPTQVNLTIESHHLSVKVVFLFQRFLVITV